MIHPAGTSVTWSASTIARGASRAVLGTPNAAATIFHAPSKSGARSCGVPASVIPVQLRQGSRSDPAGRSTVVVGESGRRVTEMDTPVATQIVEEQLDDQPAAGHNSPLLTEGGVSPRGRSAVPRPLHWGARAGDGRREHEHAWPSLRRKRRDAALPRGAGRVSYAGRWVPDAESAGGLLGPPGL